MWKFKLTSFILTTADITKELFMWHAKWSFQLIMNKFRVVEVIMDFKCQKVVFDARSGFFFETFFNKWLI